MAGKLLSFWEGRRFSGVTMSVSGRVIRIATLLMEEIRRSPVEVTRLSMFIYAIIYRVLYTTIQTVVWPWDVWTINHQQYHRKLNPTWRSVFGRSFWDKEHEHSDLKNWTPGVWKAPTKRSHFLDSCLELRQRIFFTRIQRDTLILNGGRSLVKLTPVSLHLHQFGGCHTTSIEHLWKRPHLYIDLKIYLDENSQNHGMLLSEEQKTTLGLWSASVFFSLVKNNIISLLY